MSCLCDGGERVVCQVEGGVMVNQVKVISFGATHFIQHTVAYSQLLNLTTFMTCLFNLCMIISFDLQCSKE